MYSAVSVDKHVYTANVAPHEVIGVTGVSPSFDGRLDIQPRIRRIGLWLYLPEGAEEAPGQFFRGLNPSGHPADFGSLEHRHLLRPIKLLFVIDIEEKVCLAIGRIVGPMNGPETRLDPPSSRRDLLFGN